MMLKRIFTGCWTTLEQNIFIPSCLDIPERVCYYYKEYWGCEEENNE